MNGYDPEKGLVYVPLDLNNEIIKPLERVEEKLDKHLEQHAQVEAHKAKMKRVLLWCCSAGIPLAAALCARAMGATP